MCCNIWSSNSDGKLYIGIFYLGQEREREKERRKEERRKERSKEITVCAYICVICVYIDLFIQESYNKIIIIKGGLIN